MRQAAIGVPVATVWSSPDAPSPADLPVLGAGPDMAAWLRSLSHERRLGLVGRVVTQALWGDVVAVQEEVDGWARVIVPDQPSSLDPRGYPGWVPAAQLTPCAPVTAAEHYVVAAPTVLADVAGMGLPVHVSFGTRVYRPVLAGDGRMVHSPRTGRPVEMTALATEPYASELASARRYQ